MVDTCVIERRTGQTTDPFSGVVTDTYMTVYIGKCRFQQPGTFSRPAEAGENQILLQRVSVQVPVAAAGVQVDDRVTVLTAGRDPDLVGRVFEIRELFVKTDGTAHRLGVDERTS